MKKKEDRMSRNTFAKCKFFTTHKCLYRRNPALLKVRYVVELHRVPMDSRGDVDFQNANEVCAGCDSFTQTDKKDSTT